MIHNRSRKPFHITAVALVAVCFNANMAFGQRLLVSSSGSGEVKQYEFASKSYRGNFLFSNNLRGVRKVVYGPDGNLYAASGDTDEVKRYNGRSGAFINNFVRAGSGGLSNPTGMAFGPDGNLYVASAGTNDVKKYNKLTGMYMGDFATGGDLDTPLGIAFGPDNNLYVCSSGLTSGNQGVKRYNGISGAFMNTFASGGGLRGATGLAFGPDANLYVSSGDTDEVKRYNGATGAYMSDFIAAGAGGLKRPYGLAFAPNGLLYIASTLTNEVKRYSIQTGAFVDNAASSNGLDRPSEILFDTHPVQNLRFDLNLDGQTDLLLQDKTNGSVYYWLLNGTSIGINDYIFRGNLADWKVVGTPDLNGDGRADVLLQNSTTGAVYAWILGGLIGTEITAQGTLWAGGDNRWQVVGTPDLNGDDQPDVLLRHSVTGQIYYWLLGGANGRVITSQGYVWSGNLPQWRIAAIADLNQNGTQDLVLQNSDTGAVNYWLLGGLNGVQIISSGMFWAGGDKQWKALAAPDFDGDGKPEILFQHQVTGAVQYWTLQNLQIATTGFIYSSSLASWKVVTVTDLNNDNTPDLLLQNTTTGVLHYWLMDKTRHIVQDADLFSGDLSRWTIVEQK